MELKNVEFYLSNTGYLHIIGDIYNDCRGRFVDSKRVRTTRVLSIEKKNSNLEIKTKNSIYIIKNYLNELNKYELAIVDNF